MIISNDTKSSITSILHHCEMVLIHFGMIAIELKRLGVGYDSEMRIACELHDNVLRLHQRLTKIVTSEQ